MTNQQMTIFGYAEGCPACDQLKLFLTERNIPFQSVNMERDSELRDQFRQLGYATVPICYVDGWHVGGKDEVIKTLKELHG